MPFGLYTLANAGKMLELNSYIPGKSKARAVKEAKKVANKTKRRVAIVHHSGKQLPVKAKINPAKAKISYKSTGTDTWAVLVNGSQVDTLTYRIGWYVSKRFDIRAHTLQSAKRQVSAAINRRLKRGLSA